MHGKEQKPTTSHVRTQYQINHEVEMAEAKQNISWNSNNKKYELASQFNLWPGHCQNLFMLFGVKIDGLPQFGTQMEYICS